MIFLSDKMSVPAASQGKTLPKAAIGAAKYGFFDLALTAAMFVFVLSFPFSNKCTIISLWAIGVLAIATFAVRRCVNVQAFFLVPLALFALRIGSWAMTEGMPFSKIDTCLSLFVMPLVFFLFRWNKIQLQRGMHALFYALLAGIAVCGVFFFRNIVMQHLVMEAFHNPKAYMWVFLTPPLYWQPSFVAIMMLFIVPMSFYLRFNGRIPQWLSWFSVLAALFLTYFTGARIGIVVIVLLLLFSFTFYFRRFASPERAGILLLAAALILFSRHTPYHLTDDPIRKDLRAIGISAIKENPLYGSGVCSVERFIQSGEFTQKYDLPAYPFNHTHCAPLDEVVQFGIAGGIAIAALIAGVFAMAVRRRDFLLFAWLAVYVPFMCVESPLMSVKGIMPMMFWLCLLAGTQGARREWERYLTA